MDLQYLREATRSEHEATEASMPLLGPDLTRERYIRVLRCLLPILSSWESWAEAHAPDRLRPMLASRRRSHLLVADLRTLEGAAAADIANTSQSSAPVWSVVLEAPAADSSHGTAREWEAGFLGAFYVLEGSTLGGRFLARQVETALALSPGVGNAYFQGHGAATGAFWKEVTTELAAVPEELSGRVLRTAQRTFIAFREALERYEGLSAETQPTPASAATTAMVAGTQSLKEASKSL